MTDCEDCINGHQDGCESLKPAWDLGDLLMRPACDGCCPNSCRPTGLQAAQDYAANRVRRFTAKR